MVWLQRSGRIYPQMWLLRFNLWGYLQSSEEVKFIFIYLLNNNFPNPLILKVFLCQIIELIRKCDNKGSNNTKDSYVSIYIKKTFHDSISLS